MMSSLSSWIKDIKDRIRFIVSIYILRTFPDTDRQGPCKEHVEQLLHLVAQLEPKPLPYHHVPTGAKLFVQNFFYHLSTHFIISCMLLTGIGTNLHDILLHGLIHVCVAHHWVAVNHWLRSIFIFFSHLCVL